METSGIRTELYLLPNFATVAFLSADGSTVEEIVDAFRRRSSLCPGRPPNGISWNGESRDLVDRLHSICSRWTFQTHDCTHSPLTARAAATGRDAAVPPTTWALTTWAPVAIAQPLLASCSYKLASEAFRNAQQQLLALEEHLGTLIPQAVFCAILELFWSFPEHRHLLVHWLVCKPHNLSKRIFTSLKILRNLQKTLVLTLGIQGPGGASGDPAQAILPQFRGVLGGQENTDWFVVSSKHALDVMGFLTPHLDVYMELAQSPPLAMNLQYAGKPYTTSPASEDLQVHTPELIPRGGGAIDSIPLHLSPLTNLRNSSPTLPVGLSSIPEYDSSTPQPLYGGGGGAAATMCGYKRSPPQAPQRATPEHPPGTYGAHPCEFNMTTFRHIFSPGSSPVKAESDYSAPHDEPLWKPPVATSSRAQGESSEESLIEAHIGFGDYTCDMGDFLLPPDLSQTCAHREPSFEDAGTAYETLQRFRTLGDEAREGLGWRQGLGWDFEPDSSGDDDEHDQGGVGEEDEDVEEEVWDCHRSKLEELEHALQRIRM